jgi:hypothetical protein
MGAVRTVDALGNVATANLASNPLGAGFDLGAVRLDVRNGPN